MTEKPSPALPSAPAHSLGEITRELVTINERTFVIDRPVIPNHVLEALPCPSPIIGDGSASTSTNQPPYWAALWPAALSLAKAILKESWIPGTRALEIGCGLGLPGVVALSTGLKVTFSDCNLAALKFAAHNARLNGFLEFQTLQLDWCCPPVDLKVPIMLASDLVYELRSVEPVVQFIRSVLAPGGLCLLAQLDRLPSQALRRALDISGLTVARQIVREVGPDGKRLKGALYRMRQP